MCTVSSGFYPDITQLQKQHQLSFFGAFLMLLPCFQAHSRLCPHALIIRATILLLFTITF